MKSTAFIKGIGSDSRTAVAVALALLTVVSVLAIAVTPVADAEPGTDEPSATGIVSVEDQTFETLQAAFNYIEETDTPNGNYTVSILNDIIATAKITQTQGKNVVIEGNDHTMYAKLQIDGAGNYNGTETLTIRNLDFVSASGDCISADRDAASGTYNYAHNITITGCDFTLNSSVDSVAMRFWQSFNVNVSDCEANGGHSLAQFTAAKNITIENVVSDSGRGISLGTSTPVKLSNVDITAQKYGIRGDFADGTNADIDIIGCDIKAAQPVVVRKVVDGATSTYSLDVTGCNLVPTSTYDAITLTTNEEETVVETPAGDSVVVTEEKPEPEPEEPTQEPDTTPGYDDDEDLPPFIPTQPKDSGDDVTIVACAAAAVVAALMAVFLIVSYKKE